MRKIIHRDSAGHLACPQCAGLRLSVLDSRAGKQNTIRRRRVCADCRARFTTYEIIVLDGETILPPCIDLREAIEAIRATLAALEKLCASPQGLRQSLRGESQDAISA